MPVPRLLAPYARLLRSPRKQLRQGFVRLVRSPGAPNEIAGGMALGIFVAFLPIMGIQMGVAVAIAEAIRLVSRLHLSRIAAAAGVWLTNPLTAAPIYGLCYVVGRPIARLLVPGSMPAGGSGSQLFTEAASTGSFGLGLLVALVAGGLLLGVPAAALTYLGTHRLVLRYQERRQRQRRPDDLAPAPSAEADP